MTMFSKWVRLFAAVAVCGALPRLAHGHAAAPRSQDVAISNDVKVSNETIVIEQKQTFKGQFGQTMWDLVDTDKNGKLSAKEKKDFEPQARAFFTDHSGLRVNWALLTPAGIKVDMAAWPSKKPKDFDKSPLGFTLTADYGFRPTPLDLMELVIPNLNAHQINATFRFDPALKPLRTNTGKIDEGGNAVVEMTQTDGHPDSFSVIVHRPATAAPGAPAR
jgi:hypothetical protein